MRALIQLETEKEFKIFSEVLRKIVEGGKTVACIKQYIEDEDGYAQESANIQRVVIEQGMTVQVEGKLVYATIQGLRRPDVRKIQGLWKTVVARGQSQYSQQKANDYYMTLDCVAVDEDKGYSYGFFGLHTPMFCSGDGDDDLCFAFDLADCAIDVSHYDAHEAEYYAMVDAEENSNQSVDVVGNTSTEYIKADEGDE